MSTDKSESEAPSNSLPDFDECAMRVANSNFLAKRVAEGGYGPEADSKLANELHRFIYEYDDADAYRSAWFLHRLEKLINEVKAEAQPSQPATVVPPFQPRVKPWLLECFGEAISNDREERNHRFLEEALELVQACGCTASEAHQLVDYTFGRAVGETAQEVGGVMVTLAALCLAQGIDMHAEGETELARISVPAIVAKIRAKQAAKPKHSPLPAHPSAPAESGWLPIATAPKNTPIRLYAQGGGFYDEDFNPSGSVEGQWTDDTWCGAFWDPVHDTWFRRDDIVPTHWMPLPDAPEAAAIRAGKGVRREQ